MRRIAIALGFGLALATSVAGAEPGKIALKIEKATLDNGLEVIFHEDHRTPVVAVDVWYHVGSKDEPAGKNGFAHLFEHLMFQGSKNVPEDMFFKFLERAGASDTNGTTNQDRTNYFETVPANELGLALWLESDRMGTLLDHVDQKTFESQREVVKNELRQNYENAPYGMVRMFVAAAVYPKEHPYHLLTIGTPHDLDAATLDDVRAFFKTYYVPNNATLVIAGDFQPAATKELVAKYFGPIAKGGATSAPCTKTKPIAGRRSRAKSASTSPPTSSSRASRSTGPRLRTTRRATPSSTSWPASSPTASRAGCTSGLCLRSRRSRRTSAARPGLGEARQHVRRSP